MEKYCSYIYFCILCPCLHNTRFMRNTLLYTYIIRLKNCSDFYDTSSGIPVTQRRTIDISRFEKPPTVG